jgi:hypothetical protein
LVPSEGDTTVSVSVSEVKNALDQSQLSADVEELLESDGNGDGGEGTLLRRIAALLRRVAGLTLRRIATLLRGIARLLRRIATRLTRLRERLGEGLDLAAKGVNSLRREALEASLLDGGVDLARIESTAAVSIGREESVGQLLEHLVQGDVLVEVDALGVVTIVDLDELSSGLRTQRLAAKLNLSQFSGVNLTRAILIDAIEPSSQGLHLLSIDTLVVLVEPRLAGLAGLAGLALRGIAALLRRVATLLRRIPTLLRRVARLTRLALRRIARLSLRRITTLLGRIATLLRRIATLLRRITRLAGLARLTLRGIAALLRRVRHIVVVC